jgi:hypothetical protein
MAINYIGRNGYSSHLLEQMQFPRLDPFFSRNLTRIFILSLLLLILFGILLFEVRVSEGGDDSSYLLEAMKFHQGISFPSFHGSFYSVMIGWCIGLFGFHLILFKLFSLIFLIVHQFFLYFTFRKLISPFLLSAVMLIISVNSGIIYYGSQTYTETLFMMLQSIFLYLLLNDSFNQPDTYRHAISSWRRYIGLGILIFLLSITRNVGLVAFLALVLYYFFEKRYWAAAFTASSFLIFKIAYNLYRGLFWNLHESEFHGQLSVLLQKDPYNPTLGNENYYGMLVRVFDNMNIYSSNIFLREIGLKSYANIDTSIMLTILISGIILLGIILAYRSDTKYLRAIFIYIILALITTFVSLSQMWGQARLILIFVPLLLLSMSWTLIKLSQFKNLGFVKYITVLLLALIFLSSGIRTIKKVKEHQIILGKNLAGDKFYGYTPDMRNYLALSQWASKNIPDDQLIAARKASLSFIYGNGREFYPIFKVSYASTESVLDSIASAKSTAVFIRDPDLKNKSLDQLRLLKKHMAAIISFNNKVFGLYTFEERASADSLVQPLNVPSIIGVDLFKKTLSNELQQSTSTYLPDALLDELKKNKVQYLIDANLRVDMKEKSAKTIGTITRLMMAIKHKYPEVFTLVKQMGDDGDEPARLFRINYEKCK